MGGEETGDRWRGHDKGGWRRLTIKDTGKKNGKSKRKKYVSDVGVRELEIGGGQKRELVRKG